MSQWPEDGRKVLYAATKPGLKNPDYTIVTHLDVVDAPPEQFKPQLVGSKLSARRPANPVKITRTSGANDSRYFPQFKKPMVGVGGIIDHGAHSDDEWIDLDTLGPQIDLMCDFMRE